jgi:hypothetical protein
MVDGKNTCAICRGTVSVSHRAGPDSVKHLPRRLCGQVVTHNDFLTYQLGITNL